MVCVTALTIATLALVAGGGLAEEAEDPTGNACVGVEEDADCAMVAASPDGNASCEGINCLAASASGDADGFVATSGTGNASGYAAVSLSGDTDASYHAVSATGDSTSTFLAVSGTGDSQTAGLAVSGTGDSESIYVAVSGTGDSEALLVAVSGTGGTSAEIAEVNGMQDADGCFAVSVTGSADSDCSELRALSGCDTGREAGTEELCRDAEGNHRLADAAECDTDLATSDGEGHAWCGLLSTGCVEIVWGVAAGPVFVGGHDGCQVGAFYDEDGHEHAPIDTPAAGPTP